MDRQWAIAATLGRMRPVRTDAPLSLRTDADLTDPTWVNKPEDDHPSILERIELAAMGLHAIVSEILPISDKRERRYWLSTKIPRLHAIHGFDV
jgi:hypothetical protein